MFKQEKNSAELQTELIAPETIIGKSVVVTGDLIAEGDVVIDGSLIGSLKTGGSIKIGNCAVIEADIEAKTGIIAGKVVGKIVIYEFLELQPTANIKGDVTTGQIAISQGANVNGAVTMSGKQSESVFENEPAIARKNR